MLCLLHETYHSLITSDVLHMANPKWFWQKQSCLPFHKVMGTDDMTCVYNLNNYAIILISRELHNTLKPYIIFPSYTISEYENLSRNYYKTVCKSFCTPSYLRQDLKFYQNTFILCVQMPVYVWQISYCHFEYKTHTMCTSRQLCKGPHVVMHPASPDHVTAMLKTNTDVKLSI